MILAFSVYGKSGAKFPSFDKTNPIKKSITFGFPFGRYETASTVTLTYLNANGKKPVKLLSKGFIQYKKMKNKKIKYIYKNRMTYGGQKVASISCEGTFYADKYLKSGFDTIKCKGMDNYKDVGKVSSFVKKYGKRIRTGSSFLKADGKEIVKGYGIYKNRKVIVTSTQLKKSYRIVNNQSFTLYDSKYFYPLLLKSTIYSTTKETAMETDIYATWKRLSD